MNAADWADWATVYQAGAKSARSWSESTGMHQHAEVLEAQAARCSELSKAAARREADTAGRERKGGLS